MEVHMTDFTESRAETVFRMLLREATLSVFPPGTDICVCLFKANRNLKTEGMNLERRIVLHQAYWPASREEIIRRAEEKYRLSNAFHRPFSSGPSIFEFSKRSV